MAQYTSKYGLQLPDATDYYDIGVLNENFVALEAAVQGNGIAAMVSLTREAYDMMQHDTNTLYYVDESNGTITQYKGDIQIGGNSTTPITEALLLADGGVYGQVVNASYEDLEES